MAQPLFVGPEVICVDNDGAMYGSEDGRRAGEAALRIIGEALSQRLEKMRIRGLAKCIRRFPGETLRHPEVHTYLDDLLRRGDTAALSRILADAPSRGRPTRSIEEEFTETATMEKILERESCSVSEAARIARQDHPDIFRHKTARTIENDYGRDREPYRVASQPRWIPGDKLTATEWQSPEQQRRAERRRRQSWAREMVAAAARLEAVEKAEALRREGPAVRAGVAGIATAAIGPAPQETRLAGVEATPRRSSGSSEAATSWLRNAQPSNA